MCLQRNVGIFILTGATIWLFINEIDDSKPRIARPLIIFFSVSAGLIFWTIYVWFFVPHTHFQISKPFQFALSNCDAIAHALVKAFLPLDRFSIPILFIFFGFLFFTLKSQLKTNPYLKLIFLVTVTYLIFLTLVVTINIAGFPIDYGEGDRFISVIIPFVAILFFTSFEKLYSAQRPIIKNILLIVAALWLLYPLIRTYQNVMHWHLQ
jgi:hypothetical protein